MHDLYETCNARDLRLAPSAAADEDAWTLSAFVVLREIDAAIDAALTADAAAKARARAGG